MENNDNFVDPMFCDPNAAFSLSLRTANDGWYNDFLEDMHNKKVPNPKDPSSSLAVSSLRHKRYQPEGKMIFDKLYEQWSKGHVKGKDMETHPDHINDPVPTITSIREQDKENRRKEREKRREERLERIKNKLEQKKDGEEPKADAPTAPTKSEAPKTTGWSPADAIKKRLELAEKIKSKKEEIGSKPAQEPEPKKIEAPKAETPNVETPKVEAPKTDVPATEAPKAAEPKPKTEIEKKMDAFVEQKKRERALKQQQDHEKEIAKQHLKKHLEEGTLTPEDAEEFKRQFGITDDPKKPEPKPSVENATTASPADVAAKAQNISKQKFQTTYRNVKANEKLFRGNVQALPDPNPASLSANAEETRQRVTAIADVFKGKQIDSTISDVTVGPNYTTYHMALKPEDYSKVSKSKGKDIADLISLKSQVPNTIINLNNTKGTMDIQIPNKNRNIVPWKQLVTDPEYMKKAKDPHSLSILVGQGGDGSVACVDLDKDPHVGIVGGTGSGKSVTMNGILSSIIATKKPEEVQLSIIDAGKQGAGFKSYNGVSNMTGPVIDNDDDAQKFFNELSLSIDSRNKLISKAGGNINDFNKFITKDPQTMSAEEKKVLESIPEKDRKPIPRHVIAVDEFGDLMRRYGTGKERQEFTKNIVQIAQIGRSAGVHMILATQHPNNKSMPLDVWRQLGTRLVHKVNDESASNYIGVDDAHKLNRRGDMVMMSDGQQNRVQAGFISGENPAGSDSTTDLEKFLSGTRGENPVDQSRFKVAPPPPPEKSDHEKSLDRYISDWQNKQPQRAP